jgi:integrase/recombinase XerD
VPYQFKREPLTQDEANRLAQACSNSREKLVVWTLLDTGLRVSESSGLKRENLDWQMHRLMIYGGWPIRNKIQAAHYPASSRIQPLIEGHVAFSDDFGISARSIQRLIKEVANKAKNSRPVTRDVLRHTFAVTAVQKGISHRSLQRLLGQDRLTTTEIYWNLSPEEAIREFQTKW